MLGMWSVIFHTAVYDPLYNGLVFLVGILPTNDVGIAIIVLFVCIKKQLKGILRAEAERCGGFWVTERWLGGLLTNYQTIKKQVRRLKEIEQGMEDGAFEFFTKKEQLMFE